MRARDLLREGAGRLARAGVAEASADARRLLAFALGAALDRLVTDMPERLTPEEAGRFDAAISARERRQPVSQITGRRLFWGRAFRVTPDVLDPRPETETLIAAALEMPFATVLDLGVGSGAILLTLLAERPDARGTGCDLSPEAIGVARDNAAALGVGARTTLLVSDWLAAVTGRFDLIVSNPPYIASAEMPGLAPEVREWEPHLALTPGGDGLDAYRAIAAGAAGHLAGGGRLILEIGATQAGPVTAILEAAAWTEIETRPDLDGRDRAIVARRSSQTGK